MSSRQYERIAVVLLAGVVLVGLPSSALAALAREHMICQTCHPMHNGASYPNMLGLVCEECHIDGGPAPAVKTHSSRTLGTTYGNWEIDCWGCHEPHRQEQDRTYGTAYGKLLRVQMAAEVKEINPADAGPYWYPVSILRTVNSSVIEHTSSTGFVDGDGATDDDICQVCHASTIYYNTGAAANVHADYGADSQPAGTCTSCHPHGGGFAAGAGGGCTGCHANAQPQGTGYRRQVTGTGGDFERASHHVTDGSATEIVFDDDCGVCHDQSGHQSHVDPLVVLLDADNAALTHSYDGKGASLEAFCSSCHDADSSLRVDSDANAGNGNQPFSDGRTPSDIATAWASASHNDPTPGTALGDDGCMACHGGDDGTRTGLSASPSAHGSANASMLSSRVNQVVVANVQEALCFACHDGTEALTDVAAQHGGAELWTSSGGGFLNTHHDVTDAAQAYSGAVIECTDCHDPHGAHATAKVRGDPDPTDGSVPVAGLTWAGSTFLSEWCLDCHDGSYSTSITAPTNPLVDIKTAYASDQHGLGVASKNVALRGWARGDVLQCTSCHNPGHGDDASGTVYPNLANLRAIIYDSGGNPILPDTAWDPASPYIVRITDLSAGNLDPNTNGKAWCSTCHPNPMGGNKDKGCMSGNCHNHAMGSF